MTPLAAHLAKQLVSRPKHREHIWREPQNVNQLRAALSDTHCFEVTACIPLMADLTRVFKEQSTEKTEDLFETYSFLPAPKTWVEWVHGSGNRIAVLLEEKKDTGWASATFFCAMLATNLGAISIRGDDWYDFGGDQRVMPNFIKAPDGEKIQASAFLSFSHSMLLLINSPRMIGRRQHMPNLGLERRLTQALGGSSFPLRAWTEILLQVNKPVEVDDGEPHEAHLTGQRALHFVRKHIRIRRGALEYVSAHWRGDPSLGIKQSRYAVTP